MLSAVIVLSHFFVLSKLSLCFGATVATCPSFDQLIHTLPYISDPGSQCITERDCTSASCTLPDKATVGLAIKSCDAKPSVVISANIPSSGIKNWSATFEDQTEHVIPGYFLPGLRQGYLQVSLTAKQPSDEIILTLSLKGCQINSSAAPCTLKQIISNQKLSCGLKRPVRQSGCSILKPFQCSGNETCQQLKKTSEAGRCVCLGGFSRSNDGNCEPSPKALATTTVSPNITTPHVATDEPATFHDPAALAVNIVVPILILTLVAVLVYAAFKHNLISLNRIRARLSRRRRYAVPVPSDDEDDDAPLA